MINGLGDKLQTLRTQFNMSQKEVAVAINTSPSIISNYESGERTPSVKISWHLQDCIIALLITYLVFNQIIMTTYLMFLCFL